METDEERKMHISVESLDRDSPASPRPAGVKKLDLGKLNNDLLVGQGLKKKSTTMLILPGNSPRSSSENKAHQKVKGIAAVKKAPVVSYKKPPPIGGNDNLFDRFPIKKRKPLPAGVNVE